MAEYAEWGGTLTLVIGAASFGDANAADPMRIAVTGARGFVGTALSKELREDGHSVTAITRGTERVPGANETATVSDFTNAEQLRRALTGCDSVVHLAARVHVMRERGDDAATQYRRANVDATGAILSAATEVGIRRLVFLSTSKIHGEGLARPYTETDSPQPQGAYAVSKLEAEALIRAMPAYLLGWTIIRPPLVYGPNVRGNFLRLLRLAELSLRVPVPMMGSSNRRSLVYLGNLTHLIRTSLTHAGAVGETFLVRDSEDVSTLDLLRRLAAAMGGQARVLRLPDALMRRALSVLGRSAEAQRLFGSFTVDASHAERTLGWKPPSSLDRGLEITAGWWRARGAS